MDELRYNGNSGGGCGGFGERKELEIRAKLFLQDFDSDSAADSIEAVLKHIGEELSCIHTEVCGHGQKLHYRNGIENWLSIRIKFVIVSWKARCIWTACMLPCPP